LVPDQVERHGCRPQADAPRRSPSVCMTHSTRQNFSGAYAPRSPLPVRHPRPAMNRRTVVVEGPWAFRMRRLAAARGSESACKSSHCRFWPRDLPADFPPPARSQDVEPAITSGVWMRPALLSWKPCANFPAMTRSGSPGRFPGSGTSISPWPIWPRKHAPGDLALLEARISAALPAGAMTPRDLRDLALARSNTLAQSWDRFNWNVSQVSHPSGGQCYMRCPRSQICPGTTRARSIPAWFPGRINRRAGREAASMPDIVSCRGPSRRKSSEALRWVRELLATRRDGPWERSRSVLQPRNRGTSISRCWLHPPNCRSTSRMV